MRQNVKQKPKKLICYFVLKRDLLGINLAALFDWLA